MSQFIPKFTIPEPLELVCPQIYAIEFKPKPQRPKTILEINDEKIWNYLIKSGQEETSNRYRRFLQEVIEGRRIICEKRLGLNLPTELIFPYWQQVPVPADEEDRDYVARSQYLRNVTPRDAEDDASRDLISHRFDYWYPEHHVKLICNSSYFRIANQYSTNFDRIGHLNWDMSQLNPFDLFMITGSREFSNYYSSSSLSDDYDLDFVYLLSSPSGPNKKGKRRSTALETASRSHPESLKRMKKSTTNKKWSVHEVKFLGSKPEMVFLEPSCPYQILQALRAEEQEKTLKTELEAAKKQAKDFIKANQMTQEALDEANKKLKKTKKDEVEDAKDVEKEEEEVPTKSPAMWI
uniref:Uncharacterized protein n=1 Tax=Cannabis sativa TaxID=3483 RepID=A0A803P0Z5_CANSA